MKLLTTTDQHGVTELRTWVLMLCAISSICATVWIGGGILYGIESAAGNANITTFRDGVWTVTMIMTTVGFGDYYPVTDAGRMLGWVVFVLGALELGLLIGISANAIGADKSIQNRELRSMLCEVMRKLEHIEKETGLCTKVTSESHNLDVVFRQSKYDSKRLRDGFITIGKDSTGIYMMAVDAYDTETGQEIHRWMPADSREDLEKRFKRFLEVDNEI